MQSSPKWRCNFLHFYLQLLVFLLCNKHCWDAFEQNGIYHFREISDIESIGAAAAQRFFRKIVEGVCTKSLCEFEHRADNLLYRDGKYISLRDKGTINIIEDKEHGYQISFEIDGIKFCGEWLFLGAESACPMKRKSPVRRQEIMHVLSPKGGEAARRL